MIKNVINLNGRGRDVRFEYSSNTLLKKNIIYSNYNPRISFYHSSSIIISNNNLSTGIDIYRSSNAQLICNNISNKWGGIRVRFSSKVEIINNIRS